MEGDESIHLDMPGTLVEYGDSSGPEHQQSAFWVALCNLSAGTVKRSWLSACSHLCIYDRTRNQSPTR